ncbi:hypothetical protein K8M07_05575 [Schnuerera sp. xch1]|uniref:uroporphyrinogen decarboxylase family protein n=1 Tax=Schnuerera sp. xch1 TaxID=2874283 RepID=UPI001CC10F9F|nr:uroporphyrinogen decarboxylase family protein [Schnuerera sp. xch1]MBZ2174715.1 hypothetical protein [Schnuerera sp. xch1]
MCQDKDVKRRPSHAIHWYDTVNLGDSVSSLLRESRTKVCEVLGDTVTIAGNVPPVDVLRSGIIDDVIESVKECIQKGTTSPKGYILASGCQIPVGTPKENLEAYIYASRTFGKGAKIGEMPLGMM